MDKPRIPPVIEQARKLLKNAEATMRNQCAMLNTLSGKKTVNEAKMVKHLKLFIRLICLDLASADSKIADEEADLLNAIFQQKWPPEQYAALQYDLRNDYPNLISREMGARLLACNITAAKAMRETYEPAKDWLLQTIETLGYIIIASDREITDTERARMKENLDKIHEEAAGLISSLPAH